MITITEVRVELTSEGDDKLRGFASITINDDLVIRELKIIEGKRGIFVAMPSRKLTARCRRCESKNHLRSRFCSYCGIRLNDKQVHHKANGQETLHADVCHPINNDAREAIEYAVTEAYFAELARHSREVA